MVEVDRRVDEAPVLERSRVDHYADHCRIAAVDMAIGVGTADATRVALGSSQSSPSPGSLHDIGRWECSLLG